MFSGRHTWCFVVLNLLLLAACIIATLGQETVFYFLNHQVGRLLPGTLWKNLTVLGDTLVALAISGAFLITSPETQRQRLVNHYFSKRLDSCA